MPHALTESYAEADLKLESESANKEKPTKSGKIKIIHTFEDFDRRIIEQDEAAIVYFASKDEKPGMPLLI